MYQLLLILRYLRRKLAPLFAAVAVMLCTAMVIIVISVMGGFLDLLKTTAHSLTGDIVVASGSYTGFPHYEDLIKGLEKRPEFTLATPVIEGFCLLRLYGDTTPVQVHGIEPKTFNKVVEYKDTLYWTRQDFLDSLDAQAMPRGKLTDREKKFYAQVEKRARAQYEKLHPVAAAMNMTVPKLWQPGGSEEGKGTGGNRGGLPAAVLGIEISPRQTRDVNGRYLFKNRAAGTEIALTTLPITRSGGFGDLKPTTRKFIVVNEFKSGYYEADQNRIFISFDQMQRMLDMQRQATPRFDRDTGQPLPGVDITPARTSLVMAKAAPGYTLAQAQGAAQGVVAELVKQHPDQPMLFVDTWVDRHRTLINAVENEKGLVTFLFAIISVVAIVMVATTFYMIVLEKTRDIGTLRAIGASRRGITNLFLGYGLAIGIVGSTLGLILALEVVTNLNQIQDVIAQLTGWRMWDPRIYAFDHIPDTVKATDAAAIVAGAILSSIIGALIPAVIAGRLDPIEALRYE